MASVAGLAATTGLLTALNTTSAHADGDCELDRGLLTVSELPPGSSVIECNAVGRTVVSSEGVGLEVPVPGLAVGTESLNGDGTTSGFQLAVSDAGIVTYPPLSGNDESSTDGSDASAADYPVTAESADGEEHVPDIDDAPADAPEDPNAALERGGAPSGCDDGAYNTNDLTEYNTYGWYIGDGAMPAGLSRANAQDAFGSAIGNITGQDTNCDSYQVDRVDARAEYQGTTDYEADMNSSGDCTSRDGKSTWDAGNLPAGTVAQNCWWSVDTPGAKNDLIESDVRYNTTDYDFTNKVTNSCSNRYDVRSVGTHEAGHTFGMGHVGSGHDNLTMFVNSFECKTLVRSLGKGDVNGLRSMY